MIAIRASYRDRERLNAIGCWDDTAVAISLFNKVIVTFDKTLVITMQLLIPLNGSEICRRK